jgi:DNA end-binding protein Ku
MASAVWKGSLNFGLVSIPIALYAAARREHTPLHQLHKTCHTRLKQPLYCPTHNRIVDRSEVMKGYEYEKGEYVLVDESELKKITPRSSRIMEILTFVKGEQIDPIYLDASYFALPDKEAEKPYQLLLKALTMHDREYTVFVRPRDHGLTVHTMHYQSEIREVQGYGARPKSLQVKPQEIKLAEQLVENLSDDFRPEQYHDSFQDRLRALIAAKQKGETIEEHPAPRETKVIDMMDALKKSLQQTRAAGPQRTRAGRREARRAAS